MAQQNMARMAQQAQNSSQNMMLASQNPMSQYEVHTPLGIPSREMSTMPQMMGAASASNSLQVPQMNNVA